MSLSHQSCKTQFYNKIYINYLNILHKIKNTRKPLTLEITTELPQIKEENEMIMTLS